MNRAHPVLVALLAAGLVSATAAQAVELGDASVLSQRGQRLKIAVPFGSAPGENVAVTRFAVASVVSADGRPVPAAQGFTISKPERRNVLYLQSREPVDLDRIRVEVSVSNNDVERIGYDLRVPPARYAATEAETAPAPRTVLDRRTKRRGAARRPAAVPATPATVPGPDAAGRPMPPGDGRSADAGREAGQG